MATAPAVLLHAVRAFRARAGRAVAVLSAVVTLLALAVGASVLVGIAYAACAPDFAG